MADLTLLATSFPSIEAMPEGDRVRLANVTRGVFIVAMGNGMSDEDARESLIEYAREDAQTLHLDEPTTRGVLALLDREIAETIVERDQMVREEAKPVTLDLEGAMEFVELEDACKALGLGEDQTVRVITDHRLSDGTLMRTIFDRGGDWKGYVQARLALREGLDGKD